MTGRPSKLYEPHSHIRKLAGTERHTKQQKDESALCTQSWADRPERAGSRGPIRAHAPGLEADKGSRMRTIQEHLFTGCWGWARAWLPWREGHVGAALLAVSTALGLDRQAFQKLCLSTFWASPLPAEISVSPHGTEPATFPPGEAYQRVNLSLTRFQWVFFRQCSLGEVALNELP